ncbi:MAG: MBOAT family protein, partial [Treponema sp.]|nr:MBOAT family protein [Treponema sp.]
ILPPLAVAWSVSLLLGKDGTRHKGALTAIAVTFIAAYLVFFRERSFFYRFYELLTGTVFVEPWEIRAPQGISYISLMLISYVLDVRWGAVEAQRNPCKFLLYVLFFPITASGPITRYVQVKDSLFSPHRFDWEQFCFGLQRIAWGLFKKLVVAERLAVIVSFMYDDWEEYAGIAVMLGLLLYVLQLYFDFSAFIDMVVGVAQLFGIPLPENFRTPFFSTSLSEIWRRWHITLGFWVKDYILYPVLKSRPLVLLSDCLKKLLGKKNRYARLLPHWCGMLIVWFCVGFWHGGAFKYIFGGGLYFFITIAGGQLLEPLFVLPVRFLRINTAASSWKFFQRVRTAILFAIGVSFQRASSFTGGFEMWRHVFFHLHPRVLLDSLPDYWMDAGLGTLDFLVLAFSLLLVLFVSCLEQTRGVRSRIATWNLFFRWGLFLGLSACILIFGKYGGGYVAADFIYAGF